jgi:anoctamin-4
VECRTDGFKIIRLCQRPDASDAGDIGAWYGILQFLGFLGVLTNAALLVFTANTVEYVRRDAVFFWFFFEMSMILI